MMQKETVVSTVIEPVDGAAPIAAPSRNIAGLTAFGGICCLGVILFLIATTIILSLIPIYTATHTATANTQTTGYSVTLKILNPGKLSTGDFNSAQVSALQSNLQSQIDGNSQTNGGGITISSASATATSKRRKRATIAYYVKVTGKINVKYHEKLRLILILLRLYILPDDIITTIYNLGTTTSTAASATTASG